jgi:hypothetical protein
MVTSLDGKVTGGFLENTKYSGLIESYYRIHREYAADGFLCGRVTMEGSFPQPPASPTVYEGPAISRIDFIAEKAPFYAVMSEAVKWGQRGARINSISPGIIVTPLAIDKFNGPRGDFYKNMFAKCPAGRPGTADEVANVAELLMNPQGAFITGADFLIDGGATASYFYGPLKPEK